MQAAEKAKVVARVAPLFPIGAERPQFRGEIQTPVFLTEEEARQTIIQEAQKAGLVFASDRLRIDGVSIPATVRHETTYLDTTNDGKSTIRIRSATDKEPMQKINLVLDGTDEKRKISYEFLSKEDYATWRHDKKTTYRDSMLQPSVALREGLTQGIPAGTYAVFYDPGYGSKEQAKAQLRKQVLDFIAWLKAEGVI